MVGELRGGEEDALRRWQVREREVACGESLKRSLLSTERNELLRTGSDGRELLDERRELRVCRGCWSGVSPPITQRELRLPA